MMNSLPMLGVSLDLDDLTRIEGLRDFIFDGHRDVEIRNFHRPKSLLGDWREQAERARKAFDGHRGRLGVHGPYEGFSLDVKDPEIRAIAKNRLDACVEACRIINDGRDGGFMVVHSPFTTWHWYNRGTRPASTDQTRELTHLCLRDAAEKAEDFGITIVLENIEDKDPYERVALAASFDSPSVKVSLDTGHAHYAYGVTGAPPVDSFVRAAGNALAHVHLQDTDSVADRHWAIGQGTICWHSVFRALDELDEMPRLILELNKTADALPSAHWLKAQGLAI